MHSWVGMVLISLLFQQNSVEQRIIEHLKANVAPGKPVIVSELFNNVFNTPEERKVLDRLYNTFFKIPMFMAQYYTSAKKPPTLKEIAEQFNFNVPGAADIILKVMESDPRVPKFLERDAATGEITRVDVEKIMADRRFSRALERTIAGWTGRQAPPFAAQTYAGEQLASPSLAGKPHLLYFWFTNCPPCVRTSPLLAELHQKYASQGFQIIALNADRILELQYDDAYRADYAKKVGMKFTLSHLNAEAQNAYGGVSVFPTMFFIDKGGLVVKHFVNYQEKTVLESAIQEILK